MSDSSIPVKPRPLSRRMRFEILRRDDHTCRYCGGKAPDVALQVDHVIPVALGGTDDATNLVTACRNCNAGKGSTSPDERVVAEVSDLAVRMAQALEQVAQERRAAMHANDNHHARFYDRWLELYSYNHYTNLGSGWDSSLNTFMARGLNIDDLLYLLVQPCKNSVRNQAAWRYFCGCCWNEISRREAEARKRIEAPVPAPTEQQYSDPYCVDCDGDGITKDGTYSRCFCVQSTPHDDLFGDF